MTKKLCSIFLFFLVFSNNFFATTYTSNGIGGGNWNLATTWVGGPLGTIPGAGDNVIVSAGDVVTVTASTPITNITISTTNKSTTLQLNAGVTLTASGAVTISPPTAGNADNILAIGDGILICASLTTSNSGNNNRTCQVTINTGTLTCTGNFTLGANTTRNLLTFTSSGLLQLGSNTNTIVNGQFTASTGTIEYNAAGAQPVLSLAYYSLKCSGSGIKSLSAATVLTGNLTIAGTAQLDVTAANNYGLNVAGNWNVTSTNALPFNAETGTVTLNGAALQNVTTVLAGGEVFNNLTISNTSGLNPGVQINQNQTISQTLNFTQTTTLTVTGNFTINSGTITGSQTGVLNVNGTFSDVVGGNATLARSTINVTGASNVFGTVTLSSATGTKNFNGGATFANNSNVTFSSAAVVTVGTSLTCNGTNSVTYNAVGTLNAAAVTINGTTTLDGTSTGLTNYTSTLGVAAAATLNMGNTTLAVTGLSTITGTFIVINATGAKNLNGGATLANNGNITFSAAGTLTIASMLTCNGTNTVTYTTAGTLAAAAVTVNGTTTMTGGTTGTTNFTSTTNVSAAAVLNIGNTAVSSTGAMTIDGTVNFTNANGTKTFGNVTIDAGGTWNASAVDQTYNFAAANLTNNGTFNAGATIATVYSFTGVSQMNGTLVIPSITVVSGTTTNNATLTVSNQLSGAGIFAQGTTGYLYLTLSNANFTVTTFVASAASNTVDYTLAGAQGIRKVTYYNLTLSTSGTKILLGGTTTVSNNLNISGTAQLDVDATNNYALNVGGNWNVTSTNALPFNAEAGLVTLNGSSGTQSVSTVLAGGEIFYSLTINNTSAASTDVQLQQNITVNSIYNHTLGNLDLKGKQLNITGMPLVAQTSNFTAGSIITSVAGATVTITDGDTMKTINFKGTNFGDATNGVTINCSSSSSYFNGGIFYGTVTFNKIGAGTNDCQGGCTFYGPCTFNTTTNSDRWRMGCNNPDIFYNASFNHLAITAGYNFSVARSPGNQFYGTTNIYSAASGGFYVGRSNNTTSGTADFHGPVSVTVTAAGNAYFGESSGGITNTATFESTLQLNSTASSTGDIYVGTSGTSTINITATGQMIDGTIAGATNVYLYAVTQLGNNSQTSTSTAASNSTFIIGSTTAPCIWNGPVKITSPNIDLINSTYNGSPNLLTANGSANQTCTGGNTFASGTTTTFINNGTGYWELANTNADAYNGNVIFSRTGTGKLSPAYNSNCTFGGNITIAAGSDSVDFATGGSGRVILNGTTSASFTSSGIKGTSMKRITMNKTGGASFTLSNPVGIQSAGDLTLISGLLNTSASGLLTLLNPNITSTALTDASVSYVNGPMCYNMAINATTETLNFPIGKGADCRPAVLTVRHSSATQYNYTGEVFDADPWAAFNSGSPYIATNMPMTVDTISGVHYWTIARTDASGTSQPNAGLSYSASNYPLIQLYFGTNDGVYQGASVTIVKNTSATPAAWIDIGATCALGNASSAQAGNITSTTSSTPFNSFSSFTLGSKSGGWDPLPIELLSFNAVPDGDKVDIKWETVTETNNAYFTIEKSKDGKTFTKLIDVPGAGNSTSYREYAETDYQPYGGTSYYRLKQTDNNGAYKYFTMVPVTFAEGGQPNVVLYPNPILENTTEVNAKVSGYKGQEVLVVLRSIDGKEFLSKVLVSEDDEHVFVLDNTRMLPAGTYIVTASSANNKLYNYKLIVK